MKKAGWIAFKNRWTGALGQIPLLVVALTTRCNSRCTMCGYWKQPTQDLPLPLFQQMLEDIPLLGTTHLSLTGGEPLLHPQITPIFELLEAYQQQGLSVSLITNGSALKKRLPGKALSGLSFICLSLDGFDERSHDKIRGEGMFRALTEAMRYLEQISPSTRRVARCTVQEENVTNLHHISRQARNMGFHEISFVAVDRHSSAYGRDQTGKRVISNTTLTTVEAQNRRNTMTDMLLRLAPYLSQGFITTDFGKLKDILKVVLLHKSPHFKCNAPYFSLFVDHTGQVHPCFFRPSFASLQNTRLSELLSNNIPYHGIRIDTAVKSQYCRHCTCQLYRSPRDFFSHTSS